MLSILNRSSGRGNTGEDGGDGGKASGCVGGGGICVILCLIKWIELHIETIAISSLSPRGGEIKGLFYGPLLPSFL